LRIAVTLDALLVQQMTGGESDDRDAAESVPDDAA
jgi:hypothetical protein